MINDTYTEVCVTFSDGSRIQIMGDNIVTAVTRAVKLAQELGKTDICARIERA